MKVIDRFLEYIQMDTTSDPKSETSPSSACQKTLGARLVEELKALGLSDAAMDEFGIVTAHLKGNCPDAPCLGLLAHMDTSPDASGVVHPAIVNNYQGEDIVLMGKEGALLSPREFPDLLEHVGKSLVVTDGTSLLGADDKAGICAIMNALEIILAENIAHGDLAIAFTPDEEIGRGTEHFDVASFGADFAFTVDGGALGSLETQNFNAASATVFAHGKSIHPGSAKDAMKSAISALLLLDQLLPQDQRPEHTEGFEGFFHLHELSGNVEEAQAHYLIRDHHRESFEKKKRLLEEAVSFVSMQRDLPISLEIRDEYANMHEKILPVMAGVQVAREAILDLGLPLQEHPIRGGTDGAQLSAKGLPCPNLFTGGHNFHGPYEYIAVEDLEASVKVLVDIIRRFSCLEKSIFHTT